MISVTRYIYSVQQRLSSVFLRRSPRRSGYGPRTIGTEHRVTYSYEDGAKQSGPQVDKARGAGGIGAPVIPMKSVD